MKEKQLMRSSIHIRTANDRVRMKVNAKMLFSVVFFTFGLTLTFALLALRSIKGPKKTEF